MTRVLELRGIVKRYGNVCALGGVDLAVEEGDAVVLLGPNGSGKTTLLKIAACLEKPTRGEVYIEGFKVDKGREAWARSRVTMVFQRQVMFEGTVYENVAYGLRLRGLRGRDIDNRVQEALGLTKMEGFEEREARKLSGGEQQRVALARALALNPRLLLLDEPASNIDPKNASIIQETISHANKAQGLTLVTATHDTFQAEKLGVKAVLLHGGSVLKVGKVQDVLKAPWTEAFARFENIFSGVATATEDGRSIIDIGEGLSIEAAESIDGEAKVFVRPEDIIVSKGPLASSARNRFQGEVVEATDLGSLVKLEVQAGKRFTVQVTKRSFTEMGLNIGSQVYLTFKASSVHIV